MPDLRGLSARAAVRTLARVGLVPRLKGDGFVTAQAPAAGSPLDLAGSVDLRLERASAGAGRIDRTHRPLHDAGRSARWPRDSRAALGAAGHDDALGPGDGGDLRLAPRHARHGVRRIARTEGGRRAVRAAGGRARRGGRGRRNRGGGSPSQLPWVVVPDARLALAVLADRIQGHPSGMLKVVGITGTNGKTTTAYLLRSIFEAAGMRCGLLGTVVYSLGHADIEATRTTPESADVQQMLRQMVDNGCGAAVMEVSSHALALRRADAIAFAAGVFTNLTRDHLDFHGDMESYFAAKRRLFEMLPDRRRRAS